MDGAAGRVHSRLRGEKMGEFRKIKAIIKRADKAEPYVTWVSDSLKNLQNQVGGYIETVTVEEGLVIICNEEGRLLGLPHNCEVCGCEFVGDILFVGVDGDEFADCPADLKTIRGMIE